VCLKSPIYFSKKKKKKKKKKLSEHIDFHVGSSYVVTIDPLLEGKICLDLWHSVPIEHWGEEFYTWYFQGNGKGHGVSCHLSIITLTRSSSFK